MKRNYLLLIFIIVVSMSACAQKPKGFDGKVTRISDLPDDVELSSIRGDLIVNDDYSMYVYAYDVTTMGVIESLDKLMDVLVDNDRLDLPDDDSSEYPSYYEEKDDGAADYEAIARFCRARSGEISKCWYINKGWGIIWQIDDTYAQVIAIKWDDYGSKN